MCLHQFITVHDLAAPRIPAGDKIGKNALAFLRGDGFLSGLLLMHLSPMCLLPRMLESA